jgi:DNA-binding LytR/AlgR family response regulator
MREWSPQIREPQGYAVRAARMAWGRLTDFGTGFGVAALAGVFMAIVGAFGTGDASLATRLLYWVPTMVAGAAIGAVASGMTATRAPGQSRLATWAAITLLITPPITLMVWAYTAALFGLSPGAGRYLIGAVLTVAAAMTAIMMLVRPPTLRTDAASPATATAPAFLKRLPAKLLGAELYAVEAEDHYLRLHTSKGQDLILFRLADAIAELEGLEGAQTHRSWWVSRAAIAEIRRGEGRVDLVLKSGASVPVSRRNLKSLRDLGWF